MAYVDVFRHCSVLRGNRRPSKEEEQNSDSSECKIEAIPSWAFEMSPGATLTTPSDRQARRTRTLTISGMVVDAAQTCCDFTQFCSGRCFGVRVPVKAKVRKFDNLVVVRGVLYVYRGFRWFRRVVSSDVLLHFIFVLEAADSHPAILKRTRRDATLLALASFSSQHFFDFKIQCS